MNDQQKSFNIFFFIALIGLLLLSLVLIVPSLLRSRAETDGIMSVEFETTTPDVAAIPDGLGGPQKGDVAPPFTLTDVDGNEVSLSDFAGRPVIVNFWATWCAPCRIEMPEFQAIWEEYNDEGLVILALDQDEAVETVTDYFDDEFGFTFTRPLMDTNFVVAVDYGAFRSLPTTVFITPDGIVNEVYRGALTQPLLERFVTDLLES